jgi:hypothetical protein
MFESVSEYHISILNNEFGNNCQLIGKLFVIDGGVVSHDDTSNTLVQTELFQVVSSIENSILY